MTDKELKAELKEIVKEAEDLEKIFDRILERRKSKSVWMRFRDWWSGEPTLWN